MTVGEFIESFFIGYYRPYMNAEVFDLFFASCAAIEEQVLDFWLGIFFRSSMSCMNGRPSEYGFYRSFFSMNDHSHRRSDLLVNAAVALYIDKPVIFDIIHKPDDLIIMRFYHYL